MNTEKIEVGDVWKFGGFLYHVRSIDEDGVTSVCDEGDFVMGYYDSIEDFVNRSTYIGKSKASIKDLFCVKENAENVVQTDLRNIDDMQKKIEFAKEAVDLFFKTEDESKLLEIAEWE